MARTQGWTPRTLLEMMDCYMEYQNRKSFPEDSWLHLTPVRTPAWATLSLSDNAFFQWMQAQTTNKK